ncbi:MAG: YfcE family phosphodiesterase [Patescibacteria group bacterium]|jgi:hypothetical protein
MLIAIISDIHDNLANLEKCLIWCQANKVEKIICCGDVTTLETLDFLARTFSGEIFLVSGNIELYAERELTPYKNINYCGEIGIREIDGVNLGFCHDRREVTQILETTPLLLDFIFYGHTHKPWLEKPGEVMVVNPGNIAGVFHQATFATLETKTQKLELKILTEI